MTARRSTLHLAVIVLAAAGLSACGRPGGTEAPVILEPTLQPTATLGLALPSAPAPDAGAAEAGIVFYNGVILTMDDARPTASAIRIQGERIVAVGDDAPLLAEANPSTTLVDLGGRTMMPGFIDAHTHLFHVASSFGKDDLSAQAEALQFGITSVGELWSDQALAAHLTELAAGGDLRLRVSLYVAPFLDGCGNVYDQDWYQAFAPGASLGHHLRLGGIKIYTDGGSCNAPAVSFQYPGGTGQGDLYFSQADLNATVERFAGQGYQMAIHAIGDRGIDQALEAIAAANAANPDGPRHRIEHTAVVRPDQMRRFEEVDAVGVLFGSYPTCSLVHRDGSFQYYTPDDYLSWEWPWRSLLEAAPGAHFAYHSDAYGVRPLDTFLNLHGLVTRSEFAEDGTVCQPPPALAANAIPVAQALRAMTIEGAFALGQETELGSLSPGKLADLIVLSDNPLEVAADDLLALHVQMTLVGGQVVYCADSDRALCPELPATSRPTSSDSGVNQFREDFDSVLGPGWSWEHEDPAGWSLATTPGWLRIDLSAGGFLSAAPSNVLLRPAPQGDFELLTAVRVSPTRNFEFAGLIVTFGDGQVLQFGRAYCDVPGVCTGSGYYFDNLRGGASIGSNYALPGFAGSQHILRLHRQGTTYSASYLSLDGEWIPIASHIVEQAPVSIGLLAAQAPSPGPVAEFDFIEVRTP